MNKTNYLAFIIALLYVIVGTFAVYGIYPADPFYDDWSIWFLLLTFPVTFISFSYRFTESIQNFQTVFIIQTIMIIPTFFLVRRILKGKKVNQNKIDSNDENKKRI